MGCGHSVAWFPTSMVGGPRFERPTDGGSEFDRNSGGHSSRGDVGRDKIMNSMPLYYQKRIDQTNGEPARKIKKRSQKLVEQLLFLAVGTLLAGCAASYQRVAVPVSAVRRGNRCTSCSCFYQCSNKALRDTL